MTKEIQLLIPLIGGKGDATLFLKKGSVPFVPICWNTTISGKASA